MGCHGDGSHKSATADAWAPGSGRGAAGGLCVSPRQSSVLGAGPAGGVCLGDGSRTLAPGRLRAATPEGPSAPGATGRSRPNSRDPQPPSRAEHGPGSRGRLADRRQACLFGLTAGTARPGGRGWERLCPPLRPPTTPLPSLPGERPPHPEQNGHQSAPRSRRTGLHRGTRRSSGPAWARVRLPGASGPSARPGPGCSDLTQLSLLSLDPPIVDAVAGGCDANVPKVRTLPGPDPSCPHTGD